MPTDNVLRHKKQAFLRAFVDCATITHAAEAAGIPRQTHYDWLKADPEYADAFRHAEQSVGDSLEAEAIRRAREGVERAVYHQGQVVGTERNFSDTLLIFLLKGHKPEKFKERATVTAEVTHHVESDLDRSIAELVEKLAGRSQSGAAVAAHRPGQSASS